MFHGLRTLLLRPQTDTGCFAQSYCPLIVPGFGCPHGLGPHRDMGTEERRAGSLSWPHQQVSEGCILVPVQSSLFPSPDNPSDRPPGRGHQGHNPRGEPGPGIPRHRLACQGGRCGVQPFGGRLCPCRTVSEATGDTGGRGGEGR